MQAHRYATPEVDEYDVTVCLDLCSNCAARTVDLDGPIPAPTVAFDEGYRCDGCNRRISV